MRVFSRVLATALALYTLSCAEPATAAGKTQMSDEEMDAVYAQNGAEAPRISFLGSQIPTALLEPDESVYEATAIGRKLLESQQPVQAEPPPEIRAFLQLIPKGAMFRKFAYPGTLKGTLSIPVIIEYSPLRR